MSDINKVFRISNQERTGNSSLKLKKDLRKRYEGIGYEAQTLSGE